MSLRVGCWARVAVGVSVRLRLRLQLRLRLRPRLRLRTRLRTTVDLRARRTPRLSALPTSHLGARATLGFPCRRAFGPAVRTCFDLNPWFSLEIRGPLCGLLELRPRPSLRPLVVLCFRVQRALDRRRRVGVGLAGWLARGRHSWTGRRLAGWRGADVGAVVGPGVLLDVRPGGSGSFR